MADKSLSSAMVTIHESWGENEAELIRSMLKANGIKSYLSGLFPQTVYPMTVDGLGRIEIRIATEDAEPARKLIDAHTSTPEQ